MRQKFVAVLAVLVLAVAVPACGPSSPDCVPVATETASVARLWNERTLEAIRDDFPAPTVHARNLWHLSAVMWDAWSAYTPGTESYFDADISPDEPSGRVAAIEEAISFAAHRLLQHRYEFAIGGAESLAGFDSLLADLCFNVTDEAKSGSPAAVGVAIADAAINFGASDGASEITRYIDLSYQPFNEPLVVDSDEIEMVDPNRWQPLRLSERITQNGQVEGAGVQVFLVRNGEVSPRSHYLSPTSAASLSIRDRRRYLVVTPMTPSWLVPLRSSRMPTPWAAPQGECRSMSRPGLGATTRLARTMGQVGPRIR